MACTKEFEVSQGNTVRPILKQSNDTTVNR